ncbi:unnamed protein product [Didymodactylos carnosus]|uniref:Histone H4 n=1 Tax=Didymodactylos carnosus TaxID=1234261 RepID=A0A8S2J046_9BILA|nr:unnamed protein product [Didymodactylos carnosus]CAF3775097.1 unnamed protein product [Didymodactylos carnosus]
MASKATTTANFIQDSNSEQNSALTNILQFLSESIHFIADTYSCSNLSEECLKCLTLETIGIVRFLLQDASKFSRKYRRTKMITDDFESAIKLRHAEPVIGYRLSGDLPYKSAVNSHRELSYVEDKEIQPEDVIAAPPPKAPFDISLPVMSCILDRQLCSRPDTSNHWALRDFAASRCAQMVKIWSMEIGQETIEELVCPIVKIIGERIMKITESSPMTPLDKIAIEKMNYQLLKYVPSAYRACRDPPDDIESFKQEFSNYFGAKLYNQVLPL